MIEQGQKIKIADQTAVIYMEPEEIKMCYLEAKDRRSQIRILAERNLCKPSLIIDILKSQGVDSRSLPRKETTDKLDLEKIGNPEYMIPYSYLESAALKLTGEAERKARQANAKSEFLDELLYEIGLMIGKEDAGE